MKNNEKIIDTKDNLETKILPIAEGLNLKTFKVSNILNYEVSFMTSSKSSITFRSKICTIAKLLQLISTEHYIASKKHCNQLLFVNLRVKDRDNILKFAESNNLYPTLVINSERYNYDNGICIDGEVTFCYCLKEPVTEYVKSSFVQHLKTVFHSYWDNFNTYGYSGTGKLSNLTNIIISNYIYSIQGREM